MTKNSSLLGRGGGGVVVVGVCLVCLICLVVKLLTGFEAFVPPVKDFNLGGAAIVQILKVVSEQYMKRNQLFVPLIEWI